MDLLKAVEDLLGDMECWPTYVIYNMFVEEPKPSTVKKIAAFMYGNSVPINIAVRCFNACNGLNSSFVSHFVYDWYFIWDRNPYKSTEAAYYSMSLKLWVWINGRALDQQEAVWPDVTIMQFCIESTGCPLMIKTTIKHVRAQLLQSADDVVGLSETINFKLLFYILSHVLLLFIAPITPSLHLTNAIKHHVNVP